MNLTTLTKRLEEATGPSLSLDIEIARALVPQIVVLQRRSDGEGNYPFTYRKFSANVDDGIWLAGVVLPGWTMMLDTRPVSGGACAKLFRPNEITSADKGTVAASLAIALCLAILKALQTSEVPE